MSLKRHIPNTITSMNLVCGLIGVVFALRSRLDIAFWWMLAASVCDFFDGWAARKLGAGSAFGKEMDSLSDLVSFGVLPALMLCLLMQTFRFDTGWLCWSPLVLTLFSGLRLAKFNTDPRQETRFLGLPTPAAALLCGALCCYCVHVPTGFLSTWAAGSVFIPLLALCLGLLMVSELPMFSLKLHQEDKRTTAVKWWTLVAFTVVCVSFCLVFGHHLSLAVVLVMLFYILNNLVYALFKL